MNLIVLALLLLPVWAYSIASLWAAVRFARRPMPAAAGWPAISILKPLHGVEPGLKENLRSFADQDYPVRQIVFGVRHPADGALPTARALIAERPRDDIALVVDPRANGSNLKVANLENMLPAARHDVLVIADSDMRVDRAYLAAVTAPLQDPAVGIVTCAYKGAPGASLWSHLGALQINFGFLPGAVLGDALGVGGGCFGATIALRREVLRRVGGFARLRNELADDHRLGAAVRELGQKTVLSRYLVENRGCETSLADLWQHELRWARTTRLMAPGGYAGSIVTHSMVVAILAAAASGFGSIGWACMVVSCLLRWGTAAAIARILELPATRFWLLPVRDALSFAVFVASFCGRSVLWRGHAFRVESNGRMTADGD